MLDPNEMAAYEAWKAHKLTTSVDVSASAFNLEQEAPALAYEAGVRAALPGNSYSEKIAELIEKNPYRGKGMMGHLPPKKRLSE